MDESKVIGQLVFWGVLPFFIVLFIAFAICICVIFQAHYIYTQFWPIKSLQSCCRLFSQKFKASHKSIPDSIPDLERQVSGTRRAQKIASRVNQSETLKDFHTISPRLNLFIADLSQEEIVTRRVVYRRNLDQNLLPSVVLAELDQRLPPSVV